MTYRYIDSEKIEKRRRSSTRTSGVIAIIIGLSFVACGIFFLVELKSFVGMIVMLIFALIFAGAGFYFFNQIKIEEKRSRELDDPNSKAYQKRQQYNIKKREKYLRKSEHHGSLKSILCHRAALIWGVSTIFVWLLSIVLLLASIIIFFFCLYLTYCFQLHSSLHFLGSSIEACWLSMQNMGLTKRKQKTIFQEAGRI
ncbi:MAG: hypothetical protein K2I93_01490 [Oscillospiraceae bacterium]|nr:hypothetical protein [Oscillospiraceae bacterium]